MTVKNCMTKNVEMVEPAASLREAAEKMRDGDFGMLPVTENDRLVGMLTDRDIVIRGVAEGKDSRQTQVRDVMSKSVLYCYEDQSLEEVARNLGKNQVRRLPVLSRDKRLVGILSLGDLAQSEADQLEVEDALQQISHAKPSRLGAHLRQ